MYLLKDYKEKSEYNLIAHAWLPAWVKKSGGSTICNNPELARQNSNDRSSNSFQFQMHIIKLSI